MYKIGDFSKITNLTIKTLRYYDEENILKPSSRNAENGYRFYDENDFKKAKLIALLRKLDFSISEIKDVLMSCEEPEDLSYYLKEKQAMISKKMQAEKNLIKEIDSYILKGQKEDNSMDYEVNVKDMAPVMVASIRYKGKYDEVGKYIGQIYSAAKGKAKGAPFNCYYDTEYKEEGADIEICVPVSGAVSGNDAVKVRELPGIKAICTTHIGPYEKLNMAYKAVFDYAAEHGLECRFPSREIYVKGPGMIFRGNPDKYVTEIIIPIEG